MNFEVHERMIHYDSHVFPINNTIPIRSKEENT